MAKALERADGPGLGDGSGVGDDGATNGLAAQAILVQRALAPQKRWPPAALRRGREGRGRVVLVIARDVHLEAVEVTASAGHGALDRELEAMARRAAPFPGFPANLDRARAARIPHRLRAPMGAPPGPLPQAAGNRPSRSSSAAVNAELGAKISATGT